MISINLLPKTLRKRIEPGWWRLIAIAVPVLAVGIMGVMQLSAINQENALRDEKTQLEQEVSVLNRYVEGQKQLNAQQKELEGIVAIKTQLEQGKVSWSKELSTFAAKIPRASVGRPGSAVALRSMSLKRLDAAAAAGFATTKVYDGKPVTTEFTIDGEAASRGDLTRFIAAFEGDPKFGIQFNGWTLQKEKNKYSFTATVGLVGEAPPAATPTAATGTNGQPATNAAGTPPPAAGSTGGSDAK